MQTAQACFGPKDTPPQSPPRRGGGKAKPRKRAQQELKGVL